MLTFENNFEHLPMSSNLLTSRVLSLSLSLSRKLPMSFAAN